jgi:recombinational DNA repair protein (RecF pathway)
LFRLGAAAADVLGQPGSIEALARYFEYWLLRLEGVYPAIEICPGCRQRTLVRGAALVAADRHYVCGDCAPGGPQLSAEAMAFLTAAGTRTPAEVVAAGAPRAALGELERVHARLIADHLEKPVRSARVVKELRPES